MKQAWQHRLAAVDARGLYPPLRTLTAGVNEPICTIDGRNYLTFCSNNYLSMTHHPALREAAGRALVRHGVGPGHSRVVGGTPDIVVELEEALARWTGFDDCLTFPTGYMANLGVLPALLASFFPDDPWRAGDSVVFTDVCNHGSLYDGMRLSGARIVVFRHNDLYDLERKLCRYAAVPNKLIVTEGVFCLEGQVTEVPQYAEIAAEAGALLMVDDAHGVGLLGSSGGGVAEHFRCAEQIDVYMGCMDKAMGGTGGFLCGSRELIRFLRVACRSATLSSCLPTMMAGAMCESIAVIRRAPHVRAALVEKAARLKRRLVEAGLTVLGNAAHPAIPVFIGDDQLGLAFQHLLWEQGIVQTVMRWPAVPMNQSRFRISVMVNHTEDHLDCLVRAMAWAARELGITATRS